MKYRKHYFNSPYFWHKALNLLARYLLGQVSKLFNTLVLNAQDLLGEAVNFEGVMAEEREKRAHDSGSSPLSLQARWWAEARPKLIEGTMGSCLAGALAPRWTVHHCSHTEFCNETKDNYPLRSWVFGFHTFSFGCSLFGQQQGLIEKKNSQRFQLLLMLPKCFHCHSIRLQLFNKFPVIITSFGPNSSWGFNGTHSDKI